MSEPTTMTCPDCNVPMEMAYTRQAVEVPTANTADKLFWRLPVARCPVCGAVIPTVETFTEINRSANEYAAHRFGPQIESRRRHEIEILKLGYKAFFWNGVGVGCMFTAALHTLAFGMWWPMAAWLFNGVLWSWETFRGNTPIDWLFKRIAKRMCRAAHPDTNHGGQIQ